MTKSDLDLLLKHRPRPAHELIKAICGEVYLTLSKELNQEFYVNILSKYASPDMPVFQKIVKSASGGDKEISKLEAELKTNHLLGTFTNVLSRAFSKHTNNLEEIELFLTALSTGLYPWCMGKDKQVLFSTSRDFFFSRPHLIICRILELNNDRPESSKQG